MSADSDNSGNNQRPGGILESLGCADCLPEMCLVTRALLTEGLIGAVLGLSQLGAYTVCCAAPIIQSYGLQFYRLLISWAVASGLLGTFFCLYTLFQLGQRMEPSRGSLWFGWLFLEISILTNLVVLALGLVFGWLLGVSFFLTSVCASGLWPATFGLMVIDCMAQPDQERSIMCFPCKLASKFYPPLMLLLFTLLAGFDAGMVIGALVGYALHFRPSWQLSLTTATRWEANPKLAFLTQRDGFRRAGDSGVQALGGGAWGGGAAGAAPSSSRFATVHGPSAAVASSSAAAPVPAAPSVFSGPGHRLGGSPPAAAAGPSSLLSFSNPFSSGSSSAAPAVASMGAPSDPAALEAARRQRAAAFDKRTSKSSTAQNTNTWIPKQTQQQQQGGAGTAAAATSSTSSSSGNASGARSGPVSPIAPPSVELQRPPSPSGLRSSAQRPASLEDSSGMFSLGLDDDEADELDLDDDLEQQQQGFAQGGGGGGKAGYAAVDIGGEEEQEVAPSNSADPDDNATESTSLHTQR